MLEARRHVGIEPARFGVRGQGLFEEAAVAAGMDESGEELGIIAVTPCLADEPLEPAPRLTGVGLEMA